jgi:hypothetical protein
MAAIKFKNDILPHLVAILVFLIATIIFYAPIFFDGKEISQHDILQGLGGGQEIIEYRERTGDEALWTNSMFSGMPAYLINTHWSGELLLFVQQLLFLGLPYSAQHTFLLMLSFYVLLLAFGVRPYLAIGGAIAFGFSSYNIIGIVAGHIWRVVAIAYIPLVLAGIHLIFRGRWILGFALTALALGLEIRSNHLQMTYYLLIMVVVYGIVQLIFLSKAGQLKYFITSVALIAMASILAIGANLGRLWTTYEYSQYSMRGPSELILNQTDNQSGLDKDYAFRFSNSIFEPLVLLVPNFMGGPNVQSLDVDSHLGEALRRNAGMDDFQIQQQLQHVPTYWGKQPMTAPYYAGAIMVFLFVLGLLYTDNRTKSWLITVAIIGVFLSWGDNFSTLNYFLFDHLPGYNKFRSVTFTIVMTIIAIQLLGMVGLEEWFRNSSIKNRKKTLFYSLGITGGILFLLILYSGIGGFRGPVDEHLSANVPQWFIDALRSDRSSLLRKDAFRNLVFIAITGGVLWFSLKQKISPMLTMTILVALIFMDLGMVSSRYISENNYSKNPVREYFVKTEADEFIFADPEEVRVFNLNNPFNEARTSYYHHSIGGYHGAKMRRYQDLIDHCLSQEYSDVITRLQAGNRDFSDMSALNMLNVKYIMAGDSRNHVVVNNNALGNAWVVNNIITVPNPDEEIAATCKVNPSQSAVVDVSKFPMPKTSFDAEGTVELRKYEPNYLRYETQLTDSAFVVFSEVYYPLGWDATVNGEDAAYLRTNYILRAMLLPPGNHTVEFTFKPRSYQIGNSVALASSVIILLVVFGSLFVEIKRRMKAM